MLFGSWSRRVKAFTVHESPNPPAARGDRAEQLVFVRDGFSWFAALLAPVWMLANRLWLALLGYIAVVAALIVVFGLLGIGDQWLGNALLAVHLIIGFEADSILRWTLNRRAWRQIASVTGATVEDCERRFFEEWLASVPAVSTAHFTPPGTEGGLETASSPAAAAPVSGEVPGTETNGLAQRHALEVVRFSAERRHHRLRFRQPSLGTQVRATRRPTMLASTSVFKSRGARKTYWLPTGSSCPESGLTQTARRGLRQCPA